MNLEILNKTLLNLSMKIKQVNESTYGSGGSFGTIK